jgi:hypothetical protein
MSHCRDSGRAYLNRTHNQPHHDQLPKSRRYNSISRKTYRAVSKNVQSIIYTYLPMVLVQTDTKHFQLPETPHLPKTSPLPRTPDLKPMSMPKTTPSNHAPLITSDRSLTAVVHVPVSSQTNTLV